MIVIVHVIWKKILRRMWDEAEKLTNKGGWYYFNEKGPRIKIGLGISLS